MTEKEALIAEIAKELYLARMATAQSKLDPSAAEACYKIAQKLVTGDF